MSVSDMPTNAREMLIRWRGAKRTTTKLPLIFRSEASRRRPHARAVQGRFLDRTSVETYNYSCNLLSAESRGVLERDRKRAQRRALRRQHVQPCRLMALHRNVRLRSALPSLCSDGYA
jgi:hypothetical protein